MSRLFHCGVQLNWDGFFQVALRSNIISIAQHDRSYVCHACSSVLVVFVELSEFAVKLWEVEESALLIAMRRGVSSVTKSVDDLVERKVKLIQLFGRLVKCELEWSAGCPIFGDFLERLVEVDDLLSHPLGSLLRIMQLKDAETESKNQCSNREFPQDSVDQFVLNEIQLFHLLWSIEEESDPHWIYYVRTAVVDNFESIKLQFIDDEKII